MGDFNDILHPDEKRGGQPQPIRLITGFREAVEVSALKDFYFEGYQFTWGHWKGTPLWIEAKLDLILTFDSWNALYPNAKATSITTPKSDHIQLLPDKFPIRRVGFRFENLWLREAHSRDIMLKCWSTSHGQNLIEKIGRCSKAIWIWGKYFARNFQRRLDYWRRRMDF